MISHDIFVEVRYAETDQMGVVHHGNYPLYLEQARISWLDKLGISYKKVEESGVILPVVSMQIDYKKPAYFGDVLRVKTNLSEEPNVKMIFDYEIYNQDDLLITTAKTILVFVDEQTKRPMKIPKSILSIIREA